MTKIHLYQPRKRILALADTAWYRRTEMLRISLYREAIYIHSEDYA